MAEENVNVQILNQIDKKLRRYTLESKLELFRKVSHAIDPWMPNKNALQKLSLRTTRTCKYLIDNEHLWTCAALC